MCSKHNAPHDCGGTGKTVKGKKLVEETKELELVIEKGMKDGDKTVLSGMADESLTADAGDIVFVIREGNNSGFIRKDDHLSVKKDILLADALCGYSFKIRHINGSDIHVESDSVVSPGKIYIYLIKECQSGNVIMNMAICM